MADINTIQNTNLKSKRFNFSENEINHMQALISNGTITSVGKQHASIIRETANTLNLDYDRVKKYFSNHLTKKAETATVQRKKVRIWKPNSFNVFCRETKVPALKAWKRKMDFWRQEWTKLSNQEKQQFAIKASSELLEHNVDQYSDVQKQNRVRNHLDIVRQQVSHLECLGANIMMIVIHNEKTYTSSSETGNRFLQQRQHVVWDFRSFIASPTPTSGSENQPSRSEIQQNSDIPTKESLVAAVRNMLNAKYSEACKMPGKFPFAAVGRGEVEVDGVPKECLPLTFPSRYLPAKLKLLLDAEASIMIKLKSTSAKEKANEELTVATVHRVEDNDAVRVEEVGVQMEIEETGGIVVNERSTDLAVQRKKDIIGIIVEEARVGMEVEEAGEMDTSEGSSVVRQDGEMLKREFLMTFKDRREKIALVADGQVKVIIQDFPLLNDILFIRLEFENLLKMEDEVQSQNWTKMMNKLGVLFGQDSEVHLLVQLMRNLETKTKGKHLKPVVSISEAKDLDLTSECRSPPRLVVVENVATANDVNLRNGYILADNISVRCRPGSLRSLLSDLLGVYYAWDLAFPIQYQLLGFLQKYLLSDEKEAKFFKKSTKFIKFEKQYMESV